MLKQHTLRAALHLKKFGYLIFFLPLTLPVQSYFLSMKYEDWNIFFAFFPLLIIFGLIPVLDILIGKDPVNPNEEEVEKLSNEGFYHWITLSCLPLYFMTLLSSGYILASWTDLTLIGQIGFIISQGVVGGIIAINVGHELIHKPTRLEQLTGGLLLSLVSYAGFKVEHIYGHHVNVSTPLDASSAKFNQSLYHFLPRAFLYNFLNAWNIQKKRLNNNNRSLLSIKNELLWYYLFTILVASICGGLFWLWGSTFAYGVLFFIAQSVVAFTLLEVVNYIEHYGLHRKETTHGRFERVTPEHSWNSNYLLTNMFLFQLQRHSDHHAYAARRYQVLRHYDTSPQLPFGYATMVLLALIPPIWRAVMNPRVKRYYQNSTLV